MKVICIWLIWLLPFQIHAVTVKEISRLVENVLENERVTAMEAITCWTISENSHFLKVSKVPIRLHDQFRVPHHHEEIQHFWYFIDMRCDGAHKFLYTLDREYFAHPYQWILFEPIQDHMEHLPFWTDSNILMVIPTKICLISI